jgi:hypothetical protein
MRLGLIAATLEARGAPELPLPMGEAGERHSRRVRDRFERACFERAIWKFEALLLPSDYATPRCYFISELS